MRHRTAPDFPIMFRFSQWKLQNYGARLVDTPEELATFLQPLTDAGVDIFDCSQRRFWEAEFTGSDLNLAGRSEEHTSALQSLLRISYAVFCLHTKKTNNNIQYQQH